MVFYQVLVETDNIFQKLYSAQNGCWFNPKEHHRMVHIERRTPEQARIEGAKYGHVLSVRKVKAEEIRGSIEYLDIQKSNPPKPPPDILQAKQTRFNPVLMDERIPVRKSIECVMDERLTEKVQKRRESLLKEKQKIFME